MKRLLRERRGLLLRQQPSHRVAERLKEIDEHLFVLQRRATRRSQNARGAVVRLVRQTRRPYRDWRLAVSAT